MPKDSEPPPPPPRKVAPVSYTHLDVYKRQVMKQINALERHLGLKLFDRTSQGVQLTPGGEIIYRDAKFLFDYSGRSIQNLSLIHI